MYSSRIALASFTLALAIPAAASAASLSIANLTPGAAIMPASNVSLSLVASGISYPMYTLSDSFANSSVSAANNLNAGGNFSWTPWATDAGTHVITFTANGSEGSASVQQTFTVLPPPSLTIGALNPGNSVMPGTPLTFSASATGFTNPTFTVGDTSGNHSVQPSNIDATGHFSWTPQIADNGDHTITVYVSDSLGHSASKSVSVHVGASASLSIILLNPGTSVTPGQVVTFTAAPNQYQPTGYSVYDSFAGSTASSNNMNLSGQFSWVPAASDAGVHTFTITGVVGAYGQSASTTQTITVLNPDGTTPASAVVAVPAATTPTTTSSDTTLSALLDKLAALKGALASAQAGSGASVSSVVGQFTSYLKQGSNSDEVLRLQKVLAQLGYLTATPNGNFGPATEAAVIAFQKAHGIDALGVVGPSTRAALNALGTSPTTVSTAAPVGTYVFEHFMGPGDDDAVDVSELQKRLSQLGFFSGSATGYYGPATEAAVKKFQTAHGIPDTGYVASVTRAALNK